MPSHPADVGWLLPAPSAPPDRLTKPHGEAPCTDTADRDKPRQKDPTVPEPRRTGRGGRKNEAAMRRKSRILLCFAVLWVLGIAYYFYSGTALSRKVGLPFLDCFFRATRRVRVVWRFFSQDKAKMERRDLAPRCLFFSWALFGGCTDAVRNVIKGPASISGQALIRWR